MSAPRHSVWILNHYAQAPALPGGTRHYELARRLTENGWDVSILVSSFHHPTRTLAVEVGAGQAVVRMVDGIRFVWLASRFTYRANDQRRVLNMVEYAWRAWREGSCRVSGQIPTPDVIVGSSPHLLAPLAGLRLARRFRVPFVMEVRDLWPKTLVALGALSERNLITKMLRWLELHLYRSADSIVTLLPSASRHLDELGLPEQSITYIPNGTSTLDVLPAPRENGAPVVMYAGAHGRANVLDVLLDAATILKPRRADIRFVLVGEGMEKPRLKERASSLNLSNVEFRDPVPKTDIPQLLQTADVLTLVLEDSELVSYGISLNKLYDYMAAGRPVVFAGNSSNNPIDESGCGITVPPRQPGQLADAIERILDRDAEVRASMGKRGWEHVRKHHDWTVLGEQLDRILRDVINAQDKVMGCERDDKR